MPRTARIAPGGVVFHVLNRGVGRRTIFRKEQDFAAFERVIAHTLAAVPIELFAYCLMPNHWHLLVRPDDDRQLGRFMARLTMTHTRRWQEHYHKVGDGHLYQGRFKSFPVQDDGHFLTVVRYIERNPLRAHLVRHAGDWRWSSLHRRLNPGTAIAGAHGTAQRVPISLAPWPVDPPANYLRWLEQPQTQKELESLRLSVTKGKPFGDEKWQKSTTKRLGLQSSYREAGRPKKKPAAATR